MTQTAAQQEVPHDDAQILRGLPAIWDRVHAELDKRIIGQDAIIDQLLTCMLCRGHCLIVGVPGLAKTLLVRTLAEIADLSFNRVQFTPDMMPSDITGTEILEENQTTGQREFRFVHGPVFTQLLLADEINRTPPKTQAALLEAMQEHAVTASGKRLTLDEPFFVLATQNPIEQEGTYPLPEAQLDRFMFSLNVEYPSPQEEAQILLSTTQDEQEPLATALTAADVLSLQSAVRKVHVPQSVAAYTVALVGATRPNSPGAPAVVEKYVRWGAGPRASQYLALAGKANAARAGRFNVAIEDIRLAAEPTLRHRVLLNYHAEADQRSVESVIEELIESIA